MVFRSAWAVTMFAGLAVTAVACGQYPDRVYPTGDASLGSSGSAGGAGSAGIAGSAGGGGGGGGTGGGSAISDSGFGGKVEAGEASTGQPCTMAGAHPGLDCRCADGTVEQVFSPKMVGCADVKNQPDAGVPGTTWDRRETLCGFGCKVCTAAQWIAGHPSGTITPPVYNYWTDDNLQLTSGSSGNCSVGVSDAGLTSGACPGRPMRVCVASPDSGGAVTDPSGTTCDIHECGLNTLKPNDYFGGCVANRTAGALCCCGGV